MNLKISGFFVSLGLSLCLFSSAQDFSNKGKEFWLAYSYHVGMVGVASNQPTMTLYITSDVNTPYKVEIFGVTTLQTGTITAGQVVTVTIPNSYFINNEGTFTNRAIRVTADQPVVVYSYITRSAASAATLCLPTNVLGREYYTSNFTQISNEQNSNSYFTIVAVEDNTTVEITPSATTKNGRQAGVPFTVNLNKGEVYQVLGRSTSYIGGTEIGTDLSGSKILSVASGSGGCKRIAVFSGSGKIFISATNCTDQNSSDNLYQQLYPTVSWGLKYLTVPSFNRTTNIYRITKSDSSTNVYLNGSLIPASAFTNNRYYQFYNSTPNAISANKPISVAQYFTTQGCSGNGTPYDPDMIVLNPVEQSIDKVTLVSSNLLAAIQQPNNGGTYPHQHHIHVIMRNGGTGISSFKLDGIPVPASSWASHAADPSYSYLYLNNVSQGYHRIESDSGFNAIAYGYGFAETYGYSAGANVKDLYQFASVKNEYATVDFPAACKNSPFRFSMTFPYQPTEIKWQFGGLFTDVTVSSPVYDSTWTVNGKQLYRYSLPNSYTVTATGAYPLTYPIKVIAQNPTAEGCSGEQEINYELKVYERPVADFNFTAKGCVSDAVNFADASNTNGRPSYKWGWIFGDGAGSALQNPSHLYNAAGTYNVKFAMITDIGCLSDTVLKTVTLTDPPVAKFGLSAPYCVNKTLTFTDSSTTSLSTIVKWFWDFGDGGQVTATTNASQTHTYTTPGNYNVTLKVETATGCQSIVFTKAITVSPNPVSDFNFGNACLPAGTMQFNNQSSVTDGSNLSYNWNFGDGGTSTATSPSHNYAATGPFDVKLTVTSAPGCTTNIIKTVNTIYVQPQASFTAPAEVCFGAPVNFIDGSSAGNSTITAWQWDFGDGQTSAQKNPVHNYAMPGTYTVILKATSAIGCASTIATKTILVNALPTAGFNVSSPICATRDITFTDASVANSGNLVQWVWNMGDGTTFTKTTNAAFTYSYAAAGTYTVTLDVKSDKTCSAATLVKQVVIHPLPVPGFIMPGNCLTDPFTQFTDTTKISDGTASQFTYLWNFGDQNANAGNPNTSTAANPKHKYTAIANYNVSLTVTSVNGCTASITQQFTINGTTPQSAFSIQGGNQQCSNNAVVVKDNSSVDFGNVVKLEIFWDYANDPANKSVILAPAVGGSYSHTYPEFFAPATKDYQVRVIAYSGDNCLSSVSQTVTMKATPQVVFTALNTTCADGAAFQITGAGTANNFAGAGAFTGPGISSTGIFNPQTAGVGTHVIRFTFTGTNGCVNYKEQSIIVYPVPVVNAGPDRFMLDGGSTTLVGSGTGNNITYLWTPSTGLSDATIPQPLAKPTDDITYTLTVKSSDGCSASDQVFVKVLKAPTVPNVFTPNGDGVNDTWQIQYLESYPGATIRVFNRYGQLVFESVKGYIKPWDGTFNSKPLPAGTYYYIVDPKNGRKQISGYVDIVR